MIIYTKGTVLGFSHDFWTKLHGSALPRASITSVKSVALFFLFQYVLTDGTDEIVHPYAVGFLASVTCFAVIFRSQSAIARYYEAARETHNMQSKLADATSLAITFSTSAVYGAEEDCSGEDAAKTEIEKRAKRRTDHQDFCARLIHNVSLFTATAYLVLRTDDDPNYCVHEAGSIPPAREPLGNSPYRPLWSENFPRYLANTFLFQYAAIQNRQNYYASARFPVIGGVSERERGVLEKSNGPLGKAHLIMHWIAELITDYHLRGGFGKVDPPIISRLYQEISNGMLGFSQAKRIAFLPFPFIYAQITELLVMLLVIAIPLLMTGFVDSTSVGAVITFLSCLGFCSLYEATRELEDPFLFEPNDLNMLTWQGEFNEMLLLLIRHANDKIEVEETNDKKVLPAKNVVQRDL